MSGKDGKAKNGTEEQSPDGNRQAGVTEVRVRTTRGTSLSHKESGEKSPQHCERKYKYMEPELQGKCVQDGNKNSKKEE